MNALVYVDIDQGIHLEKNKVARNEKWKKLRGFSYVKSMANSESFHLNFWLSTNPQIVRSGPVLGMSPPTVLKTDFYLHQKQLTK